MSRILIMSDIHGNLSALNKIWETEKIEEFEGIVLLGDLIDYGPHSNEVVEKLKNLPKHKILVNIWGNHEKASWMETIRDFPANVGKSVQHIPERC